MEEDLGDPGGVEDGGEDRQGTAAVGAMFHTDIEDALNSGTKTRRASRGYSRRSVGAKSHGQGCRIPERHRIPPQQTRVGSIRSRLRLGPKSCRGALGLLGRGRCLRDAAARSGCAFPPAPAALRGPSSLNTCPSLTAIGIESRDCATPGKTQVITRRTRGRPTQVWGQGKGRELIENFQASGRPNLQGKCLASVGLQAPGTTASPVLMVRSWVGLIGGFWPVGDHQHSLFSTRPPVRGRDPRPGSSNLLRAFFMRPLARSTTSFRSDANPSISPAAFRAIQFFAACRHRC